MKRSVRVLFLSVCATVVAVAIWTVALLLNLLHWVLGDSAYLRPVAWVAVGVSVLAFWVVFHRYFSRVVPAESSFE